MIINKADEVFEESFESILFRQQIELETQMYKCYKTNLKPSGPDIDSPIQIKFLKKQR